MSQKYFCTLPFKVKADQIYQVNLKEAFPGREVSVFVIAREGSNKIKICVPIEESEDPKKEVDNG